MNHLTVVVAASLVLWGFSTGPLWLGALLAAGLLGSARARLRLPVDALQLARLAKTSVLAAVTTLAGFLAFQGLPQGLINATSWLPLALFPLALATTLSDAPLHFAFRLSGSKAGLRARPPVDFARFYLAVTLLASSLAPNTDAYYWALAGVVVLWLFLMRKGTSPAPARRADTAAFALAAALAIGAGLLLGNGLERSHQAVEEWALDFLSNIDTNPYQSQTSIGDLGKVKLSERIVWRVRLQPANTPVRLRSGVFTYFNGQTWIARQDAFTPLLPATIAASQPTLHLRGQSRKGVALLPLPQETAQISGTQGRLERNPYGVTRLSDAPERIDFTASPGGPAEAPPQAADLALPPRYRPLLSRIPELAALASTNEQQRLAGLQDWFSANFRYTLFLGSSKNAQEGRSLEQFLLEDRAGHCEYFASTTVLLLRSLGIPARYVTGYSVQEYSTLEDAFLVRQRHAHAWAEAYIDGRWVEVDTTPATWLAEEEQRTPFWQPASDLLSYLWQRFGEWRQNIVIGELQGPALGLGAAVLAVLAGFLMRRLRRAGTNTKTENSPNHIAHTPERVALDQLESEFAARGLPRRAPGEPPQRWLTRLTHEGATMLGEAELARAQAIVTACYQRQYGLPGTTS